MIAVALAMATAGVPRFAPPLDAPLRYRLTDRHATPTGEAVIETDAIVTFRAVDGATLVHATTGRSRIAAPPSVAERLAATLAPFAGVPVEARLDARGGIVDLPRNDAGFAAWRASQHVVLDRLERASGRADPGRIAAIATIRAELASTTAQEAVRPAIAQYLPPPLPDLPVGGTDTRSIDLATPAGRRTARTTVTLVRADAGSRLYHIETVTDPSGAAPVFAEVTDLAVDVRVGLLLTLSSRRELRSSGAPARVIQRHEAARLP